MTSIQADVRRRGLDYFRHVVALAYREIGVLKESNHRAIFSKANILGGFFGQNRKAQVRELYKTSLTDNSITQTLQRYERRTGLTLNDVNEAFAIGKWSLTSRRCAFGGPKWAEITNVAIRLGLAIQDQNWPEVGRLADSVEKLEHNNCKLIKKFVQLD